MIYRKIETNEIISADATAIIDGSSPISATIRILTKSNIRRAVFSLSILLLMFSLSGCTTINKWRSRTPVPVSGPIEVGPEWVEIAPPNPLISREGTRQEILLFTKHDVKGDWGDDLKTLKLKDGRDTRVEAFLYDEKGNEFELFINGDVGEYVALALTPRNADKMVRFPNGQYTKLRIRSEIPIKVEKIEWGADYPTDDIF